MPTDTTKVPDNTSIFKLTKFKLNRNNLLQTSSHTYSDLKGYVLCNYVLRNFCKILLCPLSKFVTSSLQVKVLFQVLFLQVLTQVATNLLTRLLSRLCNH